MLKILVNAYACSPHTGSEPGMGWNWCVHLAKHCELHIITEGEFKLYIEEALKFLPQANNMHFYYNPVSDKVRKMCWNQGDWRFYYFYRHWQRNTQHIARRIIEKEKIKIVHQLNMVGYREPGILWKIEGINTIWGPIGGFGGIPNNYLELYSKKTGIKQRLKQFINKLQPYTPYIRNPIKQFDKIIACNSNAKYVLEKIREKEVGLISEVGAFKFDKILKEKDFNSEKFKIAWVGKNDERKALPIAFDVLKNLNKNIFELHVFGVSNNQVLKGNNLENVFLHGWLSHQQVQEELQNCHVLLFTSLFEATGTAVLEALSLGLPVLCHNTCGQGDVINSFCGYKVKMNGVNYSIEKFGKKLIYLNANRKELKKLSEGALKRVEELSWENNCKRMISIYKSFD